MCCSSTLIEYCRNAHRADPPLSKTLLSVHIVMAGSVANPFIASFVPCPVFTISHCVGLITVPYTGLPIPLVTNLWHATCFSLCVLVVVYERTCLMCLICLCLCVYVRPPAKPLSFSVCGFLSEATWYPEPPLRVLLNQLSAHSIARRPHERPFILHSALFFNQHSSFTCLSGQIASFVFVPSQASKHTTLFYCVFFFNSQPFYFSCRFSFCSE